MNNKHYLLLLFFSTGFSNRNKKSIGFLWVEDLVAVHYGYKVFGIAEINDIVRKAREHVDGGDVIAIDLPLQHFAFGIIQVPLLNQAMPLDHNELLELGIVPVLALGDAGLGDVDAHLARIQGMHQLGEGAAVVHVHLEREGGLLVRQVAEVGAVEFLGKAAGRDLGDHQGLGLFGEALQEFDYLAQSDVMGNGAVAVAALRSLGFARDDGEAIKLAMMLFALEGGKHLVHEVIDIEQLQLYAGVVDGIGQVVGKGVAEGGHGTVVVGAAPLAKEVGKTVNEHPRSGLFAILQEEVFAGFLASAILAIAKAAGEGGLLAAGEHDGTGVVMLLKRVQQGTGKAKVALHELFLVLGTVHTGQVKHEVGLLAPLVQLFGGGVQIVLKDSVNPQFREPSILAFGNILQCPTEVLPNEALGSCNKYLHLFFFL